MVQVVQPQSSRFKRLFGRTVVIAASLVVWILYDAFTLLVSAFCVIVSGNGTDWHAWAFGIVVLALPLTVLANVVAYRLVLMRSLRAFGGAMGVVQLLGVAGLLTAFAMPPLTLTSVLQRGGEIDVENRANRTIEVVLVGTAPAYWVDCSESQQVQPGASARIRLKFTNASCWRSDVVKLDVRGLDAYWDCDWQAAERVEPVVITDTGPSCWLMH